jgi:HSP20 family protein
MNALEKWNPFRTSAPWDPVRDLEEMQHRLGSLFGRRLPLLRDGGKEEFSLTEWSPPVDIAEDDKEYTVKAELPGT